MTVTWATLTVPSARAEITFPRADSDLLIFFASSSTAPSAPVLLTCQGVTRQAYREETQTLFPLGRAKPKKREEVGKRIKRDAQPGSERPFLHSRELSCRCPDHDSIDRLYTIIYMRYSKPEGKPVVCRDGRVGKRGSNHWVIKTF